MTKLTTFFNDLPWQRLGCPRSQLRLDIVLKCGQSFRWTRHDADETLQSWIGVLSGRLWLLAQEQDQLLFKTCSIIKSEESSKAEEAILKDYFQLDVDLVPLYITWSAQDPVFEQLSHTYTGIRMLRQDPVENLFSFICSSNNNIQRISGMVENLCTHYGPCVAQIGDTSFHAFPAIEDLATDGVEAHLRKLGFGYRAAYIAKTAKQLLEAGGRSYLLQLRTKSYDEAKSALLKFTGVGPKVADCILLMSLDQPAAIPVDTHMFQIAANKYLPHLKGYKSVTDRVYTEIGDHFRKLYGPYAGWAHSVLFSADLRHLQDVAPLDKKDIKNEDTPPPAKKKTKNVKKKK